jgi:large subunit ribosomal protein L21
MSVSTPSDPAGSNPASAPEAPTTAAENPASPTTAPTGSSVSTAGSGDSVYAIVEASGQQVWLQPNRYLDLDRLDAAVDSTVTLDTVLLVKDSKGITLGQPYVNGASVELTVMAHRRGPKIIVYKMRRKKKTRRKTGHRQELTRVMVRSIRVGGQPVA